MELTTLTARIACGAAAKVAGSPSSDLFLYRISSGWPCKEIPQMSVALTQVNNYVYCITSQNTLVKNLP